MIDSTEEHKGRVYETAAECESLIAMIIREYTVMIAVERQRVNFKTLRAHELGLTTGVDKRY